MFRYIFIWGSAIWIVINVWYVFLFIFSFFNIYCVSQKPSKPSIFVCLKNSRRSTRGRRRRRSNGGAFAKMLFERQSGLAARPAGCYIIHIYTFAQGAQHPRAWFTSATCRGTLSSVNVLLAHTGVYIQCVQPYNPYGTPLVFHYFVYVFSYVYSWINFVKAIENLENIIKYYSEKYKNRTFASF